MRDKAWYTRSTSLMPSLVLLAGYCFPASSPASEPQPAVSDERIPMVLTPSQLPQRLDESPSTVTVIDREMIDASGARTLVDVFRLVPGFHVGVKFNNVPTAAYHGLADEFARRMLLLVDGQRVFQYSRGVIEWNTLPIPLENVERIEVIRGPNAAAYGSNALQAVINIQTRSAAENHGVYARGAIGDDGVSDGFFRYGGQFKAMDYTLSVYSKADQGYDDIRDDKRNSGVTFVGELPVNGAGELRVLAGYSRGDYKIGSTGSSLAGSLDDQRRDFPTENIYQSLQWRQSLADDAELTATLSHNRFYYGDKGFTRKDLIPDTTLRVQFDLEEDRYDADVKYTKLISEQWRAMAGMGYQYERLQAPYFFATSDTLDNSVFQLFGHTEYRPSDPMVLNFGALLERSNLSSKDWLFLPRLSAHYHLNDQHTLRATFSTGSRQPTLYESQGRAIITVDENPDLVIHRVYASGNEQGGLAPELNRSFELGYQWLPSRSTHLDIRLFYERLSDLTVAYHRENSGLLTLSPNQTVLDFANEDDLTTQGIEAQLDWRHPSGFRLFTSYAFTHIDADGARFDNGYADSAPSHSFGMLARQRFSNGWEISANYDYQSSMQWYFDEPIDGYHKLDARAAKSFTLGNSRMLAELIGTHLLGPISDYLPDQEWDRGVLFRLSAEF